MWQTTLDVYSDYPYRCAAHKWDVDYYNTDQNGYEMAFFCERFTNYRILACECLGDECIYCKLAGHEEYLKHINPDINL